MSASVGPGMLCLVGCPGAGAVTQAGISPEAGNSCQARSGMGEGKDLVSFGI